MNQAYSIWWNNRYNDIYGNRDILTRTDLETVMMKLEHIMEQYGSSRGNIVELYNDGTGGETITIVRE